MDFMKYLKKKVIQSIAGFKNVRTFATAIEK